MPRWWAKPTPLRPTICARAAPSPTRSSPTSGCSASLSRCFSVANSTRSGSPTRRSSNSKPRRSSLPDLSREPSMQAAIDRIMQTYDLLMNCSSAASDEARAKVTDYLTKLVEAGEKDPHRLTVCGLTYLRELDGSSDPVKAGYTGL